jgi:hypothetical protein
MSQVYNVSSKQLISNYAVLQTLETNNLIVGQTITVAGVGSPFNGSFLILSLPQYLYVGIDPTTGFLLFNKEIMVRNQVLFAATGTNVNRVQSFAGTITFNGSSTADWIAWDDIATWLGIPLATQADEDFLVACASAANSWCFRKRVEAGYKDSLVNSPSPEVTLATRMVGAAYYRQRGSMDQFASYTDMGTVTVPGITPMIKQLLGIDRPAIA